MTVPFELSPALNAAMPIRHGFFGRVGGVSTGDYAGLNVSFSMGDDPDAVSANRALAAEALGGGPLVILKQVHSNRVVTVDAGALPDASVEADALVTRRTDLLLGVLTADCAPLVFVDPDARVIGAAHAGWKGAVTGILENTVAAMEAVGARRERIVIAIGPTISGTNYEVGPDFECDVLASHQHAAPAFFTPPGGRAHFDLPGFLRQDGSRAEVASVASLDACTYADPDRYFSHRYATHQGTKTGRQISIIGLT